MKGVEDVSWAAVLGWLVCKLERVKDLVVLISLQEYRVGDDIFINKEYVQVLFIFCKTSLISLMQKLIHTSSA